VKLTGEDLSRYSNKIESVSLRKYSYYHYLTKKVTSQLNNKHLSNLASIYGGKTANID